MAERHSVDDTRECHVRLSRHAAPPPIRGAGDGKFSGHHEPESTIPEFGARHFRQSASRRRGSGPCEAGRRREPPRNSSLVVARKSGVEAKSVEGRVETGVGHKITKKKKNQMHN